MVSVLAWEAAGCHEICHRAKNRFNLKFAETVMQATNEDMDARVVNHSLAIAPIGIVTINDLINVDFVG